MLNRTALKTAAKMRMAKAGFRLIGMALLIMAVSFAVSTALQARLPEYTYNITPEGITAYVEDIIDSGIVSAPALIALFVLELFMIIVNAGFMLTCLRVSRGEDIVFADLFDGFSGILPFKILLLQLLASIIIGLAAMLFVIPGIILAFSYSQAMYFLLDNPSMSVIDALRSSRKLMRGHKVEYFVFILSYYPWLLLQGLVPLAGIWVNPYRTVGEALYYQYISGRQIFIIRPTNDGRYEFYAGSIENAPFCNDGDMDGNADGENQDRRSGEEDKESTRGGTDENGGGAVYDSGNSGAVYDGEKKDND